MRGPGQDDGQPRTPALRVDADAAAASGPLARGGQGDEVGARGAGDEGALVGAEAEQLGDPADRLALQRVGPPTATARFWSRADASQSPATAAGVLPPVTKPWNRGPADAAIVGSQSRSKAARAASAPAPRAGSGSAAGTLTLGTTGASARRPR